MLMDMNTVSKNLRNIYTKNEHLSDDESMALYRAMDIVYAYSKICGTVYAEEGIIIQEENKSYQMLTKEAAERM